ncbi:HAD-IA family hydrolase [Catenulispora subtropica]|uniref:HAD-superfamily hydrolase, subfamily IA, variant 3 n=1 Tax=Catenulispora subtropica TaxID=450798 RepID=A0ABN2RWV1_9ACTN
MNQTPETPKALLLDSGGVLIRPIGGRWNPRADFEPTVRAHAPHVTADQLAAAVSEGDRFMAAVTTTPDRHDYHRAMLARIGVEATPELLADLVREVPPSGILESFPDVIPTLTALRARGVPMAVVSDAWPNLPDLHAALGLNGFFAAYAISAVLGCTKPDPRMYRHASDALGLEPGECLFVDDDPELVAAAIALGYQGRAMVREAGAGDAGDGDVDVDTAAGRGAGAASGGVATISSLTELLDLV